MIMIYRSTFRGEIERDGRMCLNGMLGAEAGGLPAEVLEEIETYFRRCIDDLSSRIGGPNAAERAFHVMAALEGGLILAVHMATSAPASATASWRPTQRPPQPLVTARTVAMTQERIDMAVMTPNSLKRYLCGLNQGISTQSSGHSFSTPSNRFWNVLYLAGFTDVRLEPKDERHLLAYGCGLTTAIRRVTRRASEISAAEFRDARPGLEERIRDLAPRVDRIPRQTWARGNAVQASDVTSGRQRSIPSGLNRGFSLDALVRAYSTFPPGNRALTASGHSRLASVAIARD